VFQTPIFCKNYQFFLIVFRNVALEKKGFPSPKMTKTGTTIAGVIYKVFSVAKRRPDNFNFTRFFQLII